MYSIFTASRYDVYDYLRCPKIVSLKTWKNLKNPCQRKKKLPRRNLTSEIGKIGEELTKTAFSEKEIIPEIPSDGSKTFEYELESKEHDTEYDLESLVGKNTLPEIELNLKNRGVILDSQMKKILRDTIVGLGKIKTQLSEKYGKIKILGHGQSRSGILPNTVLPDFIALSEGGKPIMIEVKNTSSISQKANHFQASFYNAVASKSGVVVLEERTENGINTIVPKSLDDRISETFLVYPRHGKYEKITDTISIDKNLVKNIWIAKELGLKGQAPKTDCDSKCPHHRHGELPEGNMEPLIPLSLIFAEGLIEQGSDLDIYYLRRYLGRQGIGSIISDGLFDICRAEYQTKYSSFDKTLEEKNLEKIAKKKESFLDEIAEKTGFSRQEISKITSKEEGRNFATQMARAEKEMSDSFNSWKKILNAKTLKRLRINAKGQFTKQYPIPNDSKQFVKRSWKLWD